MIAGGARNHTILQAQCHSNVVRLTAQALVTRVLLVISQNGNDGVRCVATGFGPGRDGLPTVGKAVSDLLAGFKHGGHVLLFACANWRLHLFGCVDVWIMELIVSICKVFYGNKYFHWRSVA